MRRLACVLGFGLFAATACRAEVRLGSNGASLRVQPTTAGPWSPLGTIDDSVLNPAGDLRGDGPPSWAASVGAVLAAWSAPESGGLRVALARDDRWRDLARLADERVLGTPRVRAIGEAWLIAWTRPVAETLGAEVRLVIVSSSGEVGEPIGLFEGRLVDLVVAGDAAHVIGWQAVGTGSQLSAETILFASHLPGIPQPITRTHAALDSFTAMDLTLDGPAPWWPEPTVRTLDDEESAAVLLAWWPSPGELRFVRLDAAGAELPVASLAAPGQSKRPQGLLQKALRQLGGR